MGGIGLQIQGVKVLVTGGTSGIGKALVATLSQLGARVIVVSRNAEKLLELK
jgi:NAD(P)-dependent dehydrogenase (short-subunit alcohol dehydrogenase family)